MARILVAEDDPDIRQLVAWLLVRDGHEVEVVGDGQAALDDIGASTYDVLVADVVMPGVDGVTLTRTLRDQPEERDLKIVLLSAAVRDTDVARGLAAGADDYVTKPFSPRAFGATVGRLLEQGGAA